jgi:predicted glycoside hydrolase/deacetylase ChbG (UPF0249 family)
MTRVLAMCADDFGLSMPISMGIERLAAAGRLTDVSCIVNVPAWPEVARRIDPQRLHLGLHLNLTEGRPLSPALAAHWPRLPALARLIALAHLHQLPLAALAEEIQAQLAAFEQATGRAPDHLDGHQHVHHLPQLRGLLLALLARRPGLTVRHTGRVLGPGFALKRQLIAGTGGRRLGRALQASGRARNASLLGVYDFQGQGYRRLMQGWLAALPAEGGLIFCHPGQAAPPTAAAGEDGDPIAAARVLELDYLGSAEFAQDLAAADVQLDFKRR